MTTKTKRKVSIAVIVVSAIMLLVSIAGICFSLNKNYTFNSKFSFISSDIQATITKVNVDGGTLSGNDKMQQIDVDGLITETENISTWEGLEFKLSKKSKNIEIRFNVINHSLDKTLEISIGDISNSSAIDVRFEGMDSNIKTAYVARAKTDQQGVVTQENFKQVIVTLNINNNNKKSNNIDVNIPISFKSVDAYVVDLININEEANSNTQVYTDVNSNHQQLNKNLEVCGNLITIINQTEYVFDYKFVIDNGTPTKYTIQAGANIVFAVDKDSSIVIANIIKLN